MQKQPDATLGLQKGRPLVAGDIGPRPRLRVSALPAALTFAAKIAESFSLAFSELTGGRWRTSLDKIEEGVLTPAEVIGDWFRAESQAGSMTMFLAFDCPALSALCEAAMGGTGAEQPYEFPDRPLSGIENDLVKLALSRLQASVTTVLSDILLTPVSIFDGSVDNLEGRDINHAVNFRFLVNLFGYSGEVHLAASNSELKTQFDAAGLSGSSTELLHAQHEVLQRQISNTDVAFSVALGPETLLVEELAALAPGQLVKLQSRMSAPVIVSGEGIPVFSGVLVRSGERLAVRILKSIE
jgi:flagellar motor switch protein FliM